MKPRKVSQHVNQNEGLIFEKSSPGKRAFPFHNHQVNEEMFFVIAGSGEVRIGAEMFPIRKGDIIACPAGGTTPLTR